MRPGRDVGSETEWRRAEGKGAGWGGERDESFEGRALRGGRGGGGRGCELMRDLWICSGGERRSMSCVV